jgi:hypothetical protein
MYDRETFTLWGNLTGEPVVGKMAASDARLKLIPMTLTTWSEWRKSHPETKVLRLDDSFGAKFNYRYEPGWADRARSGVDFPVWQKSKLLPDKEEVYALRIGSKTKAYSMKTLLKKNIWNDAIGDTPVVLIVDRDSESVRVYHRKQFTFAENLKDNTGQQWMLREDALEAGNERLSRIPGHVSLWFAWFGFFPQTELLR